MCVFKISRVKKYTNLVIILLFKYRFYYRATFVVIKFSWSPKTSLVHTLRKPQASRASLAPNWKASSTLNFNAEIYELLRATCLFSFKSMLFCTVSLLQWWRSLLHPKHIWGHDSCTLILVYTIDNSILSKNITVFYHLDHRKNVIAWKRYMKNRCV